MVMQADLILVMEVYHVVELSAMFPDARSKTFLLGHFAGQPVTDIRDPYDATPEEFSLCYAIIANACEGLLVRLKAHVPASVRI